MLPGLVKTLLILALVFYGMRFLTRLMLPWLIKTFARKVEKRMADQMQQSRGNGFQDEGGVSIKRPSGKKGSNSGSYDGGEYVDFEEVD